MKKLVFADTYVQKHLECAMTLVDELRARRFKPVVTRERQLPGGLDCDALVYFNLPALPPPADYDDKPRILIDHGASNLKWFLANSRRFDFFDRIVTAGPGHVDSLLAFFADPEGHDEKVTPGGFIKSGHLLAPSRFSRAEVARRCQLDPLLPIVFFAPTWHLSRQPDMVVAAEQLAEVPNHVVSFHPETVHLGIESLNVVENVEGITTELLKHADLVISDTSSTIFEAAALGKRIIQIGLREYSDNNSLLYDFPQVAGTSELFLGGVFARPGELAKRVSEVLDGSGDSLQKLLRERILADTSIDAEVTSRIVSQIASATVVVARSAGVDERVSTLRASNLRRVHDNAFFGRNRLIAHGGGDFRGHHASNSDEAVGAALAAVDVVELDFVKGADGVLVAHDTFESRFGLSQSFRETTLAEFALGRYGGELSPLTVQRALQLAARPGKAIVCDVKSPKADFEGVVRDIHRMAAEGGALDRVVLQCYSVDDFRIAQDAGFERVLLAVWKYFYLEPPGDDAYAFVAKCMEMDDTRIVGVSAPYINKHMEVPIHENPKFDRFFAFWKRLYIHGAPIEKYSDVLKQNLGLFADRFSRGFEFRDAPPAFDWKAYVFLNPGLLEQGIDNQIAATNHFLAYGRYEGRLWRFETPPDFAYAPYLDLNRGLRQAGVGGPHSAAAHWTKYGQFEGRSYKRE